MKRLKGSLKAMISGHNLGQTPGPENKQNHGMAFDSEGQPELPSIFYAPTARSKFQGLLADLGAYIGIYTRNQHKAAAHVDKKAIEHAIEVLKHFRPQLLEAYELGRDSAEIAPYLRFCPACPRGQSPPLEKNKQYCAEHRAERRARQNREAKQKQRENEKKIKMSAKVSKVHKSAE